MLQRVYAARGLSSDDDLDLSLSRLLPIVDSLPAADAAASLLQRITAPAGCSWSATSTRTVRPAPRFMIRGLRAMGFEHADFLVPNRFQFRLRAPHARDRVAGSVAQSFADRHRRQRDLEPRGRRGRARAGDSRARDRSSSAWRRSCRAPIVIVNPNAGEARFASSSLAGVGVAFYVIAALARVLPAAPFKVADLLDLVALGTVADVVPLDRNNRILVEQGLKRIRAGRCVPGIRALLEAAGRRLDQVTAADLGFAVAPRLNAAGRLHRHERRDRLPASGGRCGRGRAPRRPVVEAQRGEALTSSNECSSRRWRARRRRGSAASAPNHSGSACSRRSWHQGVVDSVAGRLKDRFHRHSVIAFARAESGRSARFGALHRGGAHS